MQFLQTSIKRTLGKGPEGVCLIEVALYPVLDVIHIFHLCCGSFGSIIHFLDFSEERNVCFRIKNPDLDFSQEVHFGVDFGHVLSNEVVHRVSSSGFTKDVHFLQFATHIVWKNIFQVFLLEKFYLNNVSVITVYRLQNAIKVICEVTLRSCDSVGRQCHTNIKSLMEIFFNRTRN